MFFFVQKLQFTCTEASIKNVYATEEAFSSPKKTSSNMKFLFFAIFVGHFCPPGSEYGSTDVIKSGSNPDPDLKHC
jgi:hypothetical protein